MRFIKFLTFGIVSFMISTFVLTGCSKTIMNTKDVAYEASFSVDTGETVSISIDKDSGYRLSIDESSFSVVNDVGEETETDVEIDPALRTDVEGVFLSTIVSNQTQATFVEDESYHEVTVDGKNGYAFEGKNDSNVKMYVHVVPCKAEGASTYLELFSAVSEENLKKVEPYLHISVE